MRYRGGESGELARQEHRLKNEYVGQVHPARIRVVHEDEVALFQVAAKFGQQRGERVGNGSQVDRDTDTARHQFSFRIAKRDREVVRIPHDERAGGTRKRARHVVRDGVETVLYQLQRHRVDRGLACAIGGCYRCALQRDDHVAEVVERCRALRRYHDRRI